MVADWLADRLNKSRFERIDITGCEAQGDADKVYMTRWVLWRSPNRFGFYIHVFHRSDVDRLMHDHPWSFVTVPLIAGYMEHTPEGVRRRWPFVPLYRAAAWRHCVELLTNRDGTLRKAVSIVIVTPKFRDWGFVLPSGEWIPWQDFFKHNGCASVPHGTLPREGADADMD